MLSGCVRLDVISFGAQLLLSHEKHAFAIDPGSAEFPRLKCCFTGQR